MFASECSQLNSCWATSFGPPYSATKDKTKTYTHYILSTQLALDPIVSLFLVNIHVFVLVEGYLVFLWSSVASPNVPQELGIQYLWTDCYLDEPLTTQFPHLFHYAKNVNLSLSGYCCWTRSFQTPNVIACLWWYFEITGYFECSEVLTCQMAWHYYTQTFHSPVITPITVYFWPRQ